MLLIKPRLDDFLFQFFLGTDAIAGNAKASQGVDHRVDDLGTGKLGSRCKERILSKFVEKIDLFSVEERNHPMGDLSRFSLLRPCHGYDPPFSS